MKLLKLAAAVLLLLCGQTGFAQADKADKSRKNVFKTNLFSPFNLGFERALGDKFSLSAAYLYTPEFDFGDAEGDFAHITLLNASTGVSGEARYYTSSEKAALNGLYLGGFYTFRVIEASGRKIYTESDASGTARFNILLTVPTDLTFYGLMLGWQKVGSGGFTFDFNIGAGRYEFGNLPNFDTSNPKTADAFETLNDWREGILPRLNLSLGYAF